MQYIPVQMIGTQRSGSNLLRLMLNQLNGVSAPHPPHILERFFPLLPYYGDLNQTSNFVRLVDDVCRLVEYNPVPWEELVLNREEIIKRCKSNSLIEIFRIIYEIRAESQSAKIWICKSMVNIQFADKLEEMEIKPLYLHLFRDGRDVALSFKKAIVGEKHIYHIAKQWKQEQEASLELLNKLGSSRVIQVKYEDLLANTENELQRICDFIQVKFNLAYADFYKSDESKHTAESGEMWKNVVKPVIPDNFNKYKKELSEEDIRIFENIAGEILEKLGYERCFENKGFSVLSESEITHFNAINNELKSKFRNMVKPEDLIKRQKQENLIKSIKEYSVL